MCSAKELAFQLIANERKDSSSNKETVLELLDLSITAAEENDFATLYRLLWEQEQRKNSSLIKQKEELQCAIKEHEQKEVLIKEQNNIILREVETIKESKAKSYSYWKQKADKLEQQLTELSNTSIYPITKVKKIIPKKTTSTPIKDGATG